MIRQLSLKRNFLLRLGERARYGLLTQEILDRVARLGVVVYPYYVVVEQFDDRGELNQDPSSQQVRFLAVQDVDAISQMPCRPQPRDRVLMRLQTNICFGIFQ